MKYKAYWNIGGYLKTFDFKDNKQFQEMCEEISVSNGEEGINTELLFVSAKSKNKKESVISAKTAYNYFGG